jgi:glutamate/tyrosine decarboxylase-like PLP-dependent enzyme
MVSSSVYLELPLTYLAHKWFNVPYACGIFYCRSVDLLTSILAGSSTPAYLASSTTPNSSPDLEWVQSVPSPLYTNLENSRRFIALPLYCAILSMGRTGYRDIVQRNIQFARDIAKWMSSPEEGGRWFEVLNIRRLKSGEMSIPLNVVLFRPRNDTNVPQVYRSSAYTQPNAACASLVRDINATKRIFVTPGSYTGGAIRIAVSNWMTGLNDDGQDLEVVKSVLRGLMS